MAGTEEGIHEEKERRSMKELTREEYDKWVQDCIDKAEKRQEETTKNLDMMLKCPACGSTNVKEHNENTYLCYNCRHNFELIPVDWNDMMDSQARFVPDTSPENERRHLGICYELHDLYSKKNADYGDSFHLSFEEEGMAMARIRLGDKMNRFKTLTRSETAMVQDESIRDTLIDLANYAVMTVMEMDRKK
jgi:hypothetical protein